MAERVENDETVLRPYNLRCEYVENPLGLETKKPRFSWMLNSFRRGEYQTAYKVIVSKTLEGAEVCTGDAWDSGAVKSGEQANVEYGGEQLRSRQRYWWRVKCWDRDGVEGPWSRIAWFETALFSQEEWKACWVSGGQLLRCDFTLEGAPLKARAYVSGLGYYELRINGVRVGDRVLDPGWTAYERRVLYTTYDVTDLLTKGRNAVGLVLGHGRYIPAWGYGSPRAIMQLEVEFREVDKVCVFTNALWKSSDGPIISDDVFNGEVYDARLEKSGWDSPGYDDSGWRQCSLVDPPGGSLTSAASCPPIKVTKTISATAMWTPKPGLYVFDLGQNFAGWVRLRVEGPRGSKVTMRYAELIDGEGMINVKPNRRAESTDAYFLKGEGVEEFDPHFTYHGFRFVEITGFPGVPAICSLEGRVVNSDVESSGGFACSNPLINRIHQAVVWGQLSNLMSIPTDCPQRDERDGWTGDAHLTVEEACLNFWMPSFYEKYVADMVGAQLEDGAITNTVPEYWEARPIDPAWGMAITVIPWALYRHYGDVRILEESYGAMVKWLRFLESKSADGILPFSKYGDWCAPGHTWPVETPGELVSSWVYYHDSLTLSKIARVLGREEDAIRYSAQAGGIREAFNRSYLKDDHYATGSQTCDVLPLAQGMAPDESVEKVLGHLVKSIDVERDGHLDTGIIGTRYILDALTVHGQAELAYRVLNQTSYPSLGYMIMERATTLWERWENLTGGGMNSHNHIMFGSVDAWLYSSLAGIRMDERYPAYGRILIKPHPMEDLSHVAASVKTVRGVVSSEWSRRGDGLILRVVIPVNAEAEVYVPTQGLRDPIVKELGELGDAERLREEKDYVVFKVGSGNYTFEAVRG